MTTGSYLDDPPVTECILRAQNTSHTASSTPRQGAIFIEIYYFNLFIRIMPSTNSKTISNFFGTSAKNLEKISTMRKQKSEIPSFPNI